MSVVINLTPEEESRLFNAADRNGFAPEELVRKLVSEHLPIVESTNNAVRRKLRQWQEERKTETSDAVSAHELFSRWAEEDSHMTEEEMEAENRLWEDFQRGSDEDRKYAGMRTLL